MAFKTDTIQNPGSTGIQSFNIGFRPKWIIIYGSNAQALDTIENSFIFRSYGLVTDNEQAAIGWASRNNFGDSDVAMRNQNDVTILVPNFSGIATVRATISFTNDGFDVDWLDVGTSSFQGHFFFLASDGGSQHKIVDFQTGTTDITNIGFQGDLAITIYSGANDSGINTGLNDDSGTGFGVANSNVQRAIGHRSKEGSDFSDTFFLQKNNFVTIPDFDGSDLFLATFDGFDSQGINLTWNATPAFNSTCYVLVIKDITSVINTITEGITQVDTGELVNALTLFSKNSFGSSDGTNQRSDWFNDEDNVDPPKVKRFMTETSIYERRDADGVLVSESNFDNFNGSKFNLTWPSDPDNNNLFYLTLSRGPTTINLSPSNTMNLSQNNQLPATLVNALNRLGIDHEALTNINQQQIEQLLNLVGDAESSIKMLNALNTITLAGEADFAETLFECLSNGIAFKQDLSKIQFSQVFESLLVLAQQIDIKINNDHLLAPINILDLTQDTNIDRAIRINLPFGPGVGRLELSQTVTVAGSNRVSTNNTISFNQSLNKILTLSRIIDQGLVLSQKVGRTFFPNASNDLDLFAEAFRKQTPKNNLALTQTAIGIASKITKSELLFSQTLTFLKNFLPIINQNLGLKQSATFQTEASDVDCTYSPFVGEVNSGITAPSTTAPILGSATLTLTFPFDTPTTTLELRNPEFANTDSLSFNRINRTTRGGTLVIFADPNWPKEQTLAVQIDVLTQQQVTNLQDFIAESLGKEIGLLDHENRQWKGIITTPDIEITQIGKKNFSVSFEFEGELQ